MYCPKCGTQNPDDTNNCINCGAFLPQKNQDEVTNTNEATTETTSNEINYDSNETNEQNTANEVNSSNNSDNSGVNNNYDSSNNPEQNYGSTNQNNNRNNMNNQQYYGGQAYGQQQNNNQQYYAGQNYGQNYNQQSYGRTPYGNQPYNNQYNGGQNYQSYNGTPYNGAPGMQRVDNHLVWAILVTLFCCLPLGIPAIIYACQVDEKLRKGDLTGATESSKNAKTFCWIAFGVGLAIIAIFIIWLIVTAAAAASLDY